MSDLLTVSQVAELLGVSVETVTRRLAKLPGVIDLGSPETMGSPKTAKRRRYRVLRIPRSVVEKYIAARGGRLTIPPPPPKVKVLHRRPPTEDDLTRDLAALALRSGGPARKLFDRIARRARALTWIPADEWADVFWCDGDDVSSDGADVSCDEETR